MSFAATAGASSPVVITEPPLSVTVPPALAWRPGANAPCVVIDASPIVMFDTGCGSKGTPKA